MRPAPPVARSAPTLGTVAKPIKGSETDQRSDTRPLTTRLKTIQGFRNSLASIPSALDSLPSIVTDAL